MPFPSHDRVRKFEMGATSSREIAAILEQGAHCCESKAKLDEELRQVRFMKFYLAMITCSAKRMTGYRITES